MWLVCVGVNEEFGVIDVSFWCVVQSNVVAVVAPNSSLDEQFRQRGRSRVSSEVAIVAMIVYRNNNKSNRRRVLSAFRVVRRRQQQHQ